MSARKPTALKLLDGNPGKQAINKREPKPRPATPTYPIWLDQEGRAEWKRIVPELELVGLLTIVDRATLAAYCDAWSLYLRTRQTLKKKGLTFKTPSGYVQQRPEVAIMQKAIMVMKAFATEFGLTPASRSRIEVAQAPVPETDLERLLD